MNRMNKEGWHFVPCIICRALLVVTHCIESGIVCNECGKGVSNAKRTQ